MQITYNLHQVGKQYLMRDGELSTPFPDTTKLFYRTGKHKGKLKWTLVWRTIVEWVLDNAFRLALRTNNKLLQISAGECLKELATCREYWKTSAYGDLEMFVWHPQTIELLTNRRTKNEII